MISASQQVKTSSDCFLVDVKLHKKCAQLSSDKKDPKFHKGLVTCVAISPDDKYLVTGGADQMIKVWNFETLVHIKDFAGHRGAITSLVFRHNFSGQLFSASKDRSIKVCEIKMLLQKIFLMFRRGAWMRWALSTPCMATRI